MVYCDKMETQLKKEVKTKKRCVLCHSNKTEYTGKSKEEYNFGKDTYKCLNCQHFWWED